MLSDTTDAEIAAEEAAASRRCASAGSGERLYYRRRAKNNGRKAGNIADWVEQRGPRYDYMIVLDADSVMSGDTMVRLAALMEAEPAHRHHPDPSVRWAARRCSRACCSSPPPLRRRCWRRATRFWQIGDANYFGHNAILRVAAFAEHCRLPVLRAGRRSAARS